MTRRWIPALLVSALVVSAGGAAVGSALTSRSSPPPQRLFIWIRPGTAKPIVSAIEASTHELARVSECAYWTQARDFAEYKRLFKIKQGGVLTVGTIPSSYRCLIPPGSSIAPDVIHKLEYLPDVYTVSVGSGSKVHRTPGV